MREETVERALEVTCPQCGADAGMECVTWLGVPLLEMEGYPVHHRRWME